MSVDPLAHPIRLAGPGLLLREWTDADLPAMPALFDEPDVARFTSIPSPFDAAAFLARIRRDRAGRGKVQLAITADDDPAPLGLAMIHPAERELGYAIGPAHRGRGLAARATAVLTAFAHDRLRLAEVHLRIHPDNGPSQAVARAAGYRVTGADDVDQIWTHRA